MKENRIETIVNEIHYWKEHRLLPGEYCDFLLALYTQGQKDSSDREIEFNNSKRNVLTLMFSLLTLILLPLSFLVIYFTEMNLILQTGLLSTFVFTAFLALRHVIGTYPVLYHFPLITGLLVCLLLFLNLVSTLSINSQWIYGMASIHCILWMGIGVRWRIHYLMISSVIGILFLFIAVVL
ncbi:hypothetical protein CEH05_12625 [Halobacillus halophilus]|uniref:hypothetical protein n=1 Tax=Halobacillus halophilus TaxID=1570 RepID=UPI00059EFD3E|nr:hypothetical protein [Halobacillus halophilus]ASF39935.1 hypothetical protein CEH05_12625 [Halobacillus halophilus]